jgi:hypothetical protein
MSNHHVRVTMKLLCCLSILGLPLCIAIQVHAQTPAAPSPPSAPAWSQPGSATHAQVAPPPDFHRPSKNFDIPIGIFEAQSDIGSPLIPGGASYNPQTGQYTVNSAGYNVWYTRDEFRYLWKKLSGDASLAADIASRTQMATVIARRSLSFARILRTTPRRPSPLCTVSEWCIWHSAPKRIFASKIWSFAWEAVGGPAARIPTAFVPIIARRIGIEKHGDSFALFVSLEGEPMHQFGPPVNLHLDGPFYVGIGFCSHVPDKSDTAVFSNLVLENSPGKFR